MSKKPEHEYGTKVRLLRLMLLLLNSPHGYTKKGLALKFGVSDDTIRNDFEAFRSAGLVLDKDAKNRYAFVIVPVSAHPRKGRPRPCLAYGQKSA